MKNKTKFYDRQKEIKAIARERVGRPKGRVVITPKPFRKEKYPADFSRLDGDA